MTPDRFRMCLTLIGWSQTRLASILNRAEATPKQWAQGRVKIPHDVALWLEGIVSFMEENPLPQRTKKPKDM